MLVLSRRESDKVLFPSLGIRIEVLRVQGNRTRLGIDVPILRHEIANLRDVEFAPQIKENADQLRDIMFTIRSRLDRAAIELNELHRRLDDRPDSQSIVDQLYQELRSLELEAHAILESSGVSANSTPRVLLVEDSAVERKLLEAYLELSGFDVASVVDGRDALDYLSLHARPDIIMLDMMMPRINGPQLVQHIRRNRKWESTLLVAISSLEKNEVTEEDPIEGVDHWYVKPINPRQIVHQIAEDLTSRSLVAA